MDTINSLLQRISSWQIEDLIVEQKLIQEGYVFYYTIDNHDILKYCFPCGLDGDSFNSNSEIDLETDIVTAYQDFFGSLSKSDPVFFLNEYILELTDLRREIINRIQRAPLFNYAKGFNEYLENLNPEKNIIEDFTLFIAIASGFIQNGAERFNSVLTNPYFIYKPADLDKINYGDLLKELISESSKIDTNFLEKIYDSFRDIVVGNRFSKRTDSEAIARLISINTQLINNHQGSKILLLFLSTTETSKKVFYKINDLLPKINNKPLNFHRTVEQLFINKLLKDLDPESRLERLIKCKELISYREKMVKNYQSKDKELEDMDELENMSAFLRELRTNYVNKNLARKDPFEIITKLHSQLDKVRSTLQHGSLKKLYSRLKKIAEENKDQFANIEAIKIVEVSFQLGQTFLAVFKKSINFLNNGSAITIGRGKDLIKGTGQHLPIVFSYSEGQPGKNFDQIGELYLNQFAFLSTSGYTSELINNVKNIANSISHNDFHSKSLAEKLVLCLYLLILPDVKFDEKTNNDIVLEFLVEQYDAGLNIEDKSQRADFLYILAWVSRRSKKFDLALKYTKEGIRLFPGDARFYHSRFLLNVCNTDEAMPGSKKLKKYLEYLSDIKKATDLYPKILKHKPAIITKNIFATLLNSEAFCYSLMALTKQGSLETQKSYLENAESKIKDLKELMGSDDLEYPEFLHTEATYLDTSADLETDLNIKKKNRKDAEKKLIYAIGIGEKLVNYNTSEDKLLLEKIQNKLRKK